MKHYVGLDVAMKETAICVFDDERRVVRAKAASEPGVVAAFLSATGLAFERIGIEAGHWRLSKPDLPVICIDARHMKAAVSAMPVKTDRISSRSSACRSTFVHDPKERRKFRRPHVARRRGHDE
jgi:transposase